MTKIIDDQQQQILDELDKYQLENQQLKEAAKRFTATKKLQNALFRIVDIANSTKDINAFYAELHAIVSELTSAKNFYIALYHPQNDDLTFPYFVDEDDDVQGEDDPLHNKERRMTMQELEGGPTHHVIIHGKTLHLDKSGIESMASIGKAPEDWIGVPLMQDEKVLGALVVQSYESGFNYSKRDENLLIYVSQHIATALRRKQDSEALKVAHQQLQEANQALEQRVEERTKALNEMNLKLSNEVNERRYGEKIQTALFKITDLVSTSVGLKDLFEGFHQTISELMYADNAYIALLSDDRQNLTFPYFADQHDARPGIIEMAKAEKQKPVSLTIRVLKSGEATLCCPSKDKADYLGPDAASWLGAPLLDQDQCFGVIVVQSYDPEHLHSEHDKSVLQTLARQISTAILRKKDAQALHLAHENLEKRVRERTSVLEKTIVNRRKIEKQLQHESLHDSLTQLPNRKYLLEQLKILLAQPKSEAMSDIALLFLDLDRFKIINDSLGHHVGDLFLIEVSKRLTQCMRNDDVVVRLGGDEFCILMNNVESERIAVATAERVLKQLRSPVIVEQHSLITSASIGVRLAKIGSDSAVKVIGDADSAMYQAKQNGKNCFCLFDANVKKIVSQRLQLEQDLREAIGGEQLSLHYQPILDLFTNEIVGVEGLIRWQHPKLGFVSPAEFIPIAEETGLIQELGESVVSMACKTLSEFSKHSETEALYANINISAIQILSRTLDEFIRKQISLHNIDPKKLNAEITESILVEDFKAATAFVQELKSIGMKVILDDFGTGYSSLSYLHQFPFDYIKLDRSFINSAVENPTNISLIESIGFLATNLGMEIVVEGIETEAQMNLATNLNYRYAQGYLFARPMPESDLLKFVAQYAGSAALV